MKKMNTTSRYKAIFWIILASISFAVAMSINKTISSNISTFTKVFTRATCGFIFLTPLIFRTGIIKTFKTNHIFLHLIRGLFGCSAIASTYYAYANLSLSLATTIGFIQPMILSLLAIIFLKEKSSRNRWIAMLVAYCGVLIAVNPFKQSFDPDIAAAILANIFSSSAIIISKQLTNTDENATILVYFTLMVMMFSGILAIFNWTPFGLIDLTKLFCLGALTTFSQYSYVQALRNGQTTLIAPFEYSRLVFTIPMGYFFFGENIYITTLTAAALIITSNLYIIYQTNSIKR